VQQNPAETTRAQGSEGTLHEDPKGEHALNHHLVIQLARMGDVVQSLPLLERLRTNHPNDIITLLVDAPLVALFERLSGIDRVCGFPMEEAWIRARESNISGQLEWWNSALDQLLQERFDQVTVLNYFQLAVTMGDMFRASRRKGYHLSEDRRQIIRPIPLNLLFASVRHRPWARWHLADMYAALAESPEMSTKAAGQIINWSQTQNSDAAANVTIGMVIGAGDPKRLLTTESHADIVHQILANSDCQIILFGGPSEQKRQHQILTSLDDGDRKNVVAKAGEIPLEELPYRLMECDLVIGPDTGPLHIAAWGGVPTLGLYFSSASVYQTGPYGRNCWVIDSIVPCRTCKEEEPCHRNQCRSQLTASAVSDMASRILQGTFDHDNPLPPDFQNGNLRLKKAQFDEFGVMYPDVSTSEIDEDTQWQRNVFGKILFPQVGDNGISEELPEGMRRRVSDVCREAIVPEEDESLAILKDFLEFEDQLGRLDTRNRIINTLRSDPKATSSEESEMGGNSLKWSVIIPVHNQCHLTRQCLESIRRTTEYRDMEILVVDNDSTDDTPHMIDRWGGPVRRIIMGKNLGFSEACNRGAAEGRGQWLLFLNNDTEVRPGWFEALDNAVTNGGEETIIGCKLLYPDGRIQHAGIAFDDRGMPIHVGKSCPADDPRWDEIRLYPAVTAAALAISRPVFDDLGGFDEGYVNGYEDVDFCLRAIEQGIHVKYHPTIEIIHYQGATPGRYRYDAQNEHRFLEKWSDVIGKRPDWHLRNFDLAAMDKLESIEQQKCALPKAGNHTGHPKRKYLVITGEPVNYPSPTLRLISPFNALREKGFLDYSVVNSASDSDMFRTELERSSKVDGIIVQRMLPQNWMTEEVLGYVDRSNVPLIVDTDDLEVGRRPRGSMGSSDDTERDKLFLEMIQRSSVITVPTETLKQLLQDWLAKAGWKDHSYDLNIAVLPNVIDTKLWNVNNQAPKASNGKARMTFLGSETHGLDLAMITPAIREVLTSHHETVELCCWGCVTEELKAMEGVLFMGPYDPDYPRYARRLPGMAVDFALVPLLPNRFNRAKSPIKYLELGISGIPGIYSNLEPYRHVVHHQESGLVVADNSGDWISAMGKLIEDKEYRESLANCGKKDVKEHHLLLQHLGKWEKVLGAL
jgi:GT2 family glycosyltransferase/ADP-heptose:LPS heptosyltransferase